MANTTYRPAQSGAILGGIWLIGLGLIFLAQQMLDIPWSRAWPLFLILAGIGFGARRFLGWGPRFGRSPLASLIGPIILIGLGVVFLVNNTGLWRIELGQLWPLVLVAIGILLLIGAVMPGSRASTDSLSLDLEGMADAEVRLRFGAGELWVAAGNPDKLVEGEFSGGVVTRRPSPNRVELQPDSDSGRWPWGGERLSWRVGLSPIPLLDLRLEGGASRAELDLRQLRIRRLDLKTGASQTTVWLPEAAGETSVSADAGAAQLNFRVPAGVAARIRSQMVVGSSQIDQGRFPSSGSGRYESPEYATATNRVDLEIRGGVGSLSIN